jgi:hypothetical protein
MRGRSASRNRAERAPHPDPLHSPSKTGVDALMAKNGAREKRSPAGLRRYFDDCLKKRRSGPGWSLLVGIRLPSPPRK